MRIRGPRDMAAGALYTALGVCAILLAREYAMGSATRMGPAYFPTVLGGLLALIGIASIIRSFLADGDPIEPFAIKAAALVLGATALFAALLRPAGTIIALAALVMVSGYASKKFKTGPMVLLAAGLTAFCVVAFVKVLGIPLPLLGRWFG